MKNFRITKWKKGVAMMSFRFHKRHSIEFSITESQAREMANAIRDYIIDTRLEKLNKKLGDKK